LQKLHKANKFAQKSRKIRQNSIDKTAEFQYH